MALTQLFVHPLKSGRGHDVQSATVTEQGLFNDRIWLVVRPNGSQITARTHHRLVLVQAQGSGEGEWRFSAPGQTTLYTDTHRFAVPHRAQVWKSEFTAQTGDVAADAWFSTLLGEPVLLLWLGQSTRRLQDGSTPLSFADGAPFLLISEASLADLNQRLSTPISIRQFRPNLVVDDVFPFEEDEWHQIRIGEVVFEKINRCTRCIFITIDPDSALPHPDRQPLTTLMQYRRLPEGVCFGINLRARNCGILHVGDPLEVVQS